MSRLMECNNALFASGPYYIVLQAIDFETWVKFSIILKLASARYN